MSLLSIRPLGWGDWFLCWQLAADPVIRHASLDRGALTHWGHAKWMRRQIASGSAFVILERGKAVGTLRGASLPGGGSEVSIALQASARGRGIGKQVLREFTHRVAMTAGQPVFARIRSENAASVAAFLAAGYGHPGTADWARISEGKPGIYVLRFPKETE